MTASKIVLNAASGVGGAGLDVEEVFSTFLYDGTGSAQTITNNIDLSGEGGLVWTKNRDASYDHIFVDSARGLTNSPYIISNTTGQQGTDGNGITQFNSNGYTMGNSGLWNANTNSHVSWTFRKAPKFFDVVTYTGDASDQVVSHSLGSTPGMIIIKATSASGDWTVYHRGLSNNGSNYSIKLNSTAAETNTGGLVATSSTFTLYDTANVNTNGRTYVAYLFAHNNNDGEFGPDADADIIKCGSYTGNGSSTGPVIDLGFEPQWLLIKNASSSANWELVDSMRDFRTPTINVGLQALNPNLNNTEAEGRAYGATSTGFSIVDNHGDVNTNGNTYIYMAIRRGTKVPESGTEVFDIDTYGGTSPNPPAWTSGFPVDMALWKAVNSASYSTWNAARLISGKYLQTAATNAELSMASHVFDYQNGWNSDTGSNSNSYSWMWKRAPNYMDVVAFTGTGSAGTHNHNLTIPAEMMWVKSRAGNGNWFVYHSGLGATKYLFLNETSAAGTASSVWNDTAPTSSVFSVGASVNQASASIAYLFASLDGISKVGSYTGNGSFQTIDCGFSAGSRFVLIKRTNATGDWYVWDADRGITQAADPYLELNTTAAETTGNKNYLYPASSGFGVQEINGTNNPNINVSSATYIFYAIA